MVSFLVATGSRPVVEGRWGPTLFKGEGMGHQLGAAKQGCGDLGIPEKSYTMPKPGHRLRHYKATSKLGGTSRDPLHRGTNL